MGVKDLADIEYAKVSPQTVGGIENPAVYYPTLYGAPDGITLYTYYDNICYGFVTGENVVTSTANMSFTARAAGARRYFEITFPLLPVSSFTVKMQIFRALRYASLKLPVSAIL